MNVPDPLWIGEDSIELKQDCIRFKNKTITVVDKVIEKWSEENKTYYNKTIYKEEIVQVCIEYHQFIDKVDMTNLKVFCKDYPTQIICDSRIVNGEGDGNGDGICQSGMSGGFVESCLIFNKSDSSYKGTDYLGKKLIKKFKTNKLSASVSG